MKFKLEIKIDNDAFFENEGYEVERILKEIGAKNRDIVSFPEHAHGSASDLNGRRVARWSVENE